MTRCARSVLLHYASVAAAATGRGYYLIIDQGTARVVTELRRGVRLRAIIGMHDNGKPAIVRV